MNLEFATVDPEQLDPSTAISRSLCAGEWLDMGNQDPVLDPLTGQDMFTNDVLTASDFAQFGQRLTDCPTYGQHNPWLNVERYRMLGRVSARAAAELDKPEVAEFFARLIMRIMPKSHAQAMGEVTVTRIFLENFSGDGVRMQLAAGFSVPGDHDGQESHGYRWPYGPVVIVAPFNFPLEIPALQLMGALYMGNFPIIKAGSIVSIVLEQFVRLLIHCGLPAKDMDIMNCGGRTMNQFLTQHGHDVALLQFTGGSDTAESLSDLLHGRVKLEDAGFNVKLLGPDFDPHYLNFVGYQSDQDAFAASGQKCSAESLTLAHANWGRGGYLQLRQQLAMRRRLDNLTIGPVLTVDNDEMNRHVQALLDIPDTRLLFGGEPLVDHTIPECYGAFQPTAVLAPIEAMQDDDVFRVVTKELFAPAQVVLEYSDDQMGLMLELLERMPHRLTFGVASNDQTFQRQVLGRTNVGTTYVGMRARTTGAPQNHSFGPCGDPRSASIGTPGAIIGTWSCHREIVQDEDVPLDFVIPAAS